MLRCPNCGHENLPSFPTCSKCGAGFTPGAEGLPPHLRGAPGIDVGQSAPRVSAPNPYAPDRGASLRRRNLMIIAIVSGLLLVVVGVPFLRDSSRRGETQAKLDWADRFFAVDKQEMGSFWTCVLSSNVDVGLFAGVVQFQQRIEAAYATQPADFGERMTTECVPKLERARQQVGALKDPPAELAATLESYRGTLPRLQSGLETYVENLKGRAGVKDFGATLIEAGDAWHSDSKPSAKGIAYERFLHCAVPGLLKMKDAQALLVHLHEACFKKDAAAFMAQVKKTCGDTVMKPEPGAAAPKTWAVSHQRFYEDDARQLRAWESCLKKAGKGQKAGDMEDLLTAIGEHMQARAEFAQGVRNIAGGAK
jgi:hypothetical protein